MQKYNNNNNNKSIGLEKHYIIQTIELFFSSNKYMYILCDTWRDFWEKHYIIRFRFRLDS